jgi:hypothetical protein
MPEIKIVPISPISKKHQQQLSLPKHQKPPLTKVLMQDIYCPPVFSLAMKGTP